MGRAKDVLMPAALNDRSRMLSEMVNVGEANAIDARRQTAPPPAPHQPGNVDQDVTASGAITHFFTERQCYRD
jgi:hypothetical protein